MLSSIFSYCLANSRQLKSQNTEEFTKSIAAYAVIVKNKQTTPPQNSCGCWEMDSFIHNLGGEGRE